VPARPQRSARIDQPSATRSFTTSERHDSQSRMVVRCTVLPLSLLTNVPDVGTIAVVALASQSTHTGGKSSEKWALLPARIPQV
jgi:hypothetical protein